ncbi:MAG: carbon starvation CstA family protein, partial [Planctomycetota bacterium]
RNKGKSIGEVAASLIGHRARVLFLCLIVVLTWLVLAAFASIIGNLFHAYPASVFPVNLEIPIAIGIGFWVHKRGGGILVPSILAVLAMWGAVGLSTAVPSLQWSLPAMGGLSAPKVWVVLLLCYSFITCVLPVWVLLQPRDFINSHQLFLGLGIIYLSLFLSNPEISAPAVNEAVPDGVGGMFPRGTTSKQIGSLKHARAIGYGSMLGEGCLAIAATMAVAAGLSAADWHSHYGAAASVKGKALPAFVDGTSNLLQGAFQWIDGDLAKSIVAVIVISFAATTLDTACRIQRFCLAELGEAWNFKPLRNMYVGAAIAAFSPLALVIEPEGAAALWRQVWPVFGSSNQMLGALALLVITLWLKRKGKPLWFTGIPAVFLTVITGSGLVTLISTQLGKDGGPTWAVLAPAVILLILAAAILAEGALALFRNDRPATEL